MQTYCTCLQQVLASNTIKHTRFRCRMGYNSIVCRANEKRKVRLWSHTRRSGRCNTTLTTYTHARTQIFAIVPNSSPSNIHYACVPQPPCVCCAVQRTGAHIKLPECTHTHTHISKSLVIVVAWLNLNFKVSYALAFLQYNKHARIWHSPVCVCVCGAQCK